MKTRFWKTLGHSFVVGGGPFLVVFGIVLTIVVWQIDRDATIRLWIALLVGGLLGTLTVTFFKAARETFRARGSALPRVQVVVEAPSHISGEGVIMLLEPSDLFSHNTLVSFYLCSGDGFERFMGIGKFRHVQENGKIQAEVLDWEREDILTKLKRNDVTVLRRILVKPSVPDTYIDLVRIIRGGEK